MLRTFLVLLLALLVAYVATAATSTPTATPTLPGGLRPVVTCEASSAAAIVAADVGSHALTGKTGIVHKFTIGSQEVYLLTRIQRSSTGLWVDLVASDTAANLRTLASALDLATVTSSSHPAPTVDACDLSLITASGG